MILPQGLIDKQASQFTYYLIKRQPTKLEIGLYKRAIAGNKNNISSKDERILEFVDDHSWSIGLIDSCLALTNPHSEMRRRLLIMFSILECMPKNYDQFIPKQHASWYWLVVGYTCAQDALKVAAGSVLLKVIT